VRRGGVVRDPPQAALKISRPWDWAHQQADSDPRAKMYKSALSSVVRRVNQRYKGSGDGKQRISSMAASKFSWSFSSDGIVIEPSPRMQASIRAMGWHRRALVPHHERLAP